MAGLGRGRGATLPAWMLKDPDAVANIGGLSMGSSSNGYGAPQHQGQYADAMPPQQQQQHHHQPPPMQQQQQSAFAPPPPQQPSYGQAPPPSQYEDRGRPPQRGGVMQSYGGPPAHSGGHGSHGSGHGVHSGGNAGTYSQSSRKNRHERSTSADRDRRDVRRKKRRERGSYFDVLPEGMDEATANQIAAQAFLQQTMPSAMSGMNPMMAPAAATGALGAAATSTSAAPSMQQTRHARRLYVGNVPRISDTEVQKFFEVRVCICDMFVCT